MSIFNFSKKKEQEDKKVPEKREGILDLLEFTINDNHCAVKVESVKEIVPYQKLTPSGLKHPAIEGIFDLENKPITVIDLRKYMGIHTGIMEGSFIVVNTFGRDAAIHVDSVIGVNSVPKNEVLIPKTPLKAVIGAVKIENVPTAIFNVDSILAEVFSVS
jgi:two-component system chemotaxis response regulator CheV